MMNINKYKGKHVYARLLIHKSKSTHLKIQVRKYTPTDTRIQKLAKSGRGCDVILFVCLHRSEVICFCLLIFALLIC